MSTPSFKVISLRPPLTPRAARVVADLFAHGWMVARRLLAQARCRPDSRADEAAEVRALAHRLRDNNPSFANDLLVAAALHEARRD